MSDLLPPNATRIERAYAESGGRALTIDAPIEQLWDARLCPAPFLPWLAWALSVDNWDDRWPEARKRQAIADAPQAHRVKGTVASLHMAMAMLGCRAQITEWWQTTPPGRRGTFRVRAYAAERLYEGGPVLTPERIVALREAIRTTKPKSRAFDLELLAGVDARAGVASRGQAASYGSGLMRATPRRLTPMRAGVASRGQTAQMATGLMRGLPFAAPNVAASPAQTRGRVVDKRDYWPDPAPGRVLRKWFATDGVGEWLRQDIYATGASPWGHPAFALEERDVSYGRAILLNRWLMHRRPDAIEEWGDVLPIGSPYDAAPQYKTLIFARGAGIIWGGKLRIRSGDVARQAIATDAQRTTPTPQVVYPWDRGYQTVRVSAIYPYYLLQDRAYLDVIRVDIRQAFYLDWSLSDANAVNYDVTYLFAAGLGMIDQAVAVNGVASGGRTMTRYAWSDI